MTPTALARVLATVAATALSACGPAIQRDLAPADAGAILEEFAASAEGVAACSAKDVARLRSAVASLSASSDRAGETWPSSMMFVRGGVRDVSRTEAFLVGALIGGFLEPEDFAGAAAEGAAGIRAAADRQNVFQDDALSLDDIRRLACADLFAAMQDMGAYVAALSRFAAVRDGPGSAEVERLALRAAQQKADAALQRVRDELIRQGVSPARFPNWLKNGLPYAGG